MATVCYYYIKTLFDSLCCGSDHCRKSRTFLQSGDFQSCIPPVRTRNSWATGTRLNINMSSYQYRKSHCGDKTILQPPYFHNGFSYTDKTTYLYWIGAQDANMFSFYLIINNLILPGPTESSYLTTNTSHWIGNNHTQLKCSFEAEVKVQDLSSLPLAQGYVLIMASHAICVGKPY